jgi:hypothetical protein
MGIHVFLFFSFPLHSAKPEGWGMLEPITLDSTWVGDGRFFTLGDPARKNQVPDKALGCLLVSVE